MKSPKISIIVAASKNRGIGKDNKLLFKIPDDLKRFKSLTMGHPIIMGRKTFESIGVALSGRTNIVITRNAGYQAKDCIVASSLENALKKAKEEDKEEVFIIGGGQIFDQALAIADKIYLTLILKDLEADTFFPDYSDFKRVVFEEEKTFQDVRYKFIDLEK